MGWARGVIEVSYFRYSDRQVYYEESGEDIPRQIFKRRMIDVDCIKEKIKNMLDNTVFL